ncbi:MAG: hypothetical protein LBO64_00625 [Desulfovibrio sp.]|jgi:hypothetical protein|nr:hypothetical protein [Desulfovibrio sp.]
MFDGLYLRLHFKFRRQQIRLCGKLAPRFLISLFKDMAITEAASSPGAFSSLSESSNSSMANSLLHT